jgi:hypothetical protein
VSIERHALDGIRLHPLRLNDITASRVAAAANVSRYLSRQQLWAELSGLLTSTGMSSVMRRGVWFEPAVVAAIKDEYPDWNILYPVQFYFRDPARFTGASPDMAAEIPGLPGVTNVQLKTTSPEVFRRDWAAGPPLDVRCQTLFEADHMEVGQSKVAVLVISAHNPELHVYDVPNHPAALERLHAAAEEMHRMVRDGTPPPADPERDADTLAALYPVSVPEPVLDLSGDNRLPELLAERVVRKETISVNEKALVAIDTEIKDKLREAEKAELPGWVISWKSQTRAEKTTPASSFRVLRVTPRENAA